MDNPKNDHYYVLRMREDLAFIIRHMRNTGPEEFERAEILQDAMMFRLIQLSENARKLSDEYKQGHPSIPWTAVYGLRNRIVHNYGSIDLRVIYETLSRDIPELQTLLTEDL